MSGNKSILAIVMIGALGLGYTHAADKKQPSTSPADTQAKAPKIRCDKPVYEFSEVWAGTKIEHAFTIHNDGNANLVINRVHPGCGCTTVPNYDKNIPPGGQGKIAFSVTTSAVSVVPKKTVYHKVYSNDPKTPELRLTTTGKLKLAIALKPTNRAYFGNIKPNQKVKPIIVTATNNTDMPMKLEPMPNRGTSIYSSTINEKEPGKVAEITITAKPPFRQGNNRTFLKFKTGLTKLPTLSINCQLNSIPLVQITPTNGITIRLSDSTKQPTTTGRAYIKYNGDGEMKIQSAESSNPAIKVEFKPQVAGKSYYLTAQVPNDYVPKGRTRPKITINTDAQDKPFEIFVNITSASASRTANYLIGKPAPKTSVYTSDTQQSAIGESKNKVTVLNFWATYCAVCRRQLVVLEKIYKDYNSKGVEFLDICTDPKNRTHKEIKEIARKIGTNAPIALDRPRQASVKYYVKSLPTLLLVGKTGTVEAVHIGAGSTPDQLKALETSIRSELDLLLAGKTRADFPKKPSQTKTTVTEEPKLTIVNSAQRDTGRHKPGETVTHDIVCRNNGKKPLKIIAVKTVKGDVKVDPDYPKEILYGKAGVLRCKFTTPTKPGKFINQLNIETNDPAGAKTLVTLNSEARPYLEIAPTTGADFSRKTMTHSISRPVTVIYNGADKVEYLSADSSSGKFKATVVPIGDGPYAKVIVTSIPPFDPGENKAVITIKTTCKEQPTVEVPVKLFLPPDVEVVPDKVSLRKSPRLQTSTVSIINNGLPSLNILGIKTSHPKIRTQFYPERDGRSYKLQLTIPGNFDNGTEPAKVTISTDNDKYKEIVIPIEMN